MKKVIAIVAALAVVALLGVVLTLNPQVVEFRFTGNPLVSWPLGRLLVAAFVGGLAVALGGAWLRRLGRSVADWPSRRRERRATRLTALERQGLQLAWDGDLERSRAMLLKAWRNGAGNSEAALALASSYVETGEIESARKILEKAVVRDSRDPDLRCALGEIVRRGGEKDEAIRILESVRVQNPRAVRVLVALRDLYAECGLWHNAVHVQEAYVAQATNSVRLPAESGRLLHFRYQAALGLEDRDARREALSLLVQEDGNFAPAIVSLGDALVECGRATEAVKLWERAFRRMPRLVFIERLLPQCEAPRDRRRIVGLLWKYRERLDESSLRVLTARLALEEGNAESAAGEIEMAARREIPAVRRLWADVERQRGNLEQALAVLGELADRGAANPRGYHCAACGRYAGEWLGYCSQCGHWDSYRTNAEID